MEKTINLNHKLSQHQDHFLTPVEILKQKIARLSAEKLELLKENEELKQKIQKLRPYMRKDLV